ncbi:PDZ domain-containing protein 11 [Petromyzon marinus]|uniref:PDZ domain-containing protein 11 n=1 Tax=Petromyzon marinus TaxID=7757 RepID=A0AAJ7XFQ6_PETMA|nr:PDZ domain-containing protein 11 [Petromyzon marinus]XP_032832776.1 PDZ domain-containing protein 11 [Petromyzon marinus]
MNALSALPMVELPRYEPPPPWIPKRERLRHPDYNNDLNRFLPRTVHLLKPPGGQLGFNIRGGRASQLGIYISKVLRGSDAERVGLREGDQVLAVNAVDFQDIEHAKAVEVLKSSTEITMRVRFFPYGFRRQTERNT